MRTPYDVGNEIMNYVRSEWALATAPTIGWVTEFKALDVRKPHIVFTPAGTNADYYVLGSRALRNRGSLIIDFWADSRDTLNQIFNEFVRILRGHVSGTNYSFVGGFSLEDRSNEARRVYRYVFTLRFTYYDSDL